MKWDIRKTNIYANISVVCAICFLVTRWHKISHTWALKTLDVFPFGCSLPHIESI